MSPGGRASAETTSCMRQGRICISKPIVSVSNSGFRGWFQESVQLFLMRLTVSFCAYQSSRLTIRSEHSWASAPIRALNSEMLVAMMLDYLVRSQPLFVRANPLRHAAFMKFHQRSYFYCRCP